VKHRPKAKTDPRRVCVLDRRHGEKLVDYGEAPGISYRCNSRSHIHVTAAEAKRMVRSEGCEWIGGHRKMIMWGVDKTWAKTPSESVSTMQLLPASRVAGRRGRKAQKLPKLSTQMGSNVARWNDGRLK